MLKASIYWKELFVLGWLILFVGCTNKSVLEQTEASVVATRAYEDGNEVAVFIGENDEIGVERSIIVYKDGSVDTGDGRVESILSPHEVEDLYSYLCQDVTQLKSAHQLNLINRQNCAHCSEFTFYDYAFEEFVTLQLSYDMDIFNLTTDLNQEQIQLSATYTQNRIKEYVETLHDEPQSSELIIDLEIYSEGTIEGDFDFSIYSDGAVNFADGRVIEIPVEDVVLLKEILNGVVFRDRGYSGNGSYELLYETTDCSDCFKITLASYGKEPYITFQGNIGDESISSIESNVLYEIDSLYRDNLMDALTEKE